MGQLLDELKSKFTDELIEEFAREIKWKNDLLKMHIDKLHSLSVEDRSIFIEKCIAKYTSDKYKDREMFKCGREPQCDLYNLLFEYGLVYGKIWEKDEMFLAITESKKVVMGEGDDSQVSFEKHKIFLYKEDFQKFMAGLTEAISFINHSDMNDYISRLNEEADIKREQEALAEEAQEDKLENEIKIDIDF